MLTVKTFSATHAESLADLINNHLAMLPVVWRTSAREVSASLWGSAWPHGEFWDSVGEQRIYCAVESERDHVVGAAQVCRLRSPEGRDGARGSGIVNWLFFYPDRVDASALLLNRALGMLAAHDCRPVVAFDQCGGLKMANFTVGHLSSRWPHVAGALEGQGFRRSEESLNHLIASELVGGRELPASPCGIEVTWLHGRQSEVRAREARTHRPVGFCTTWDMSRAAEDPAAAEWEFVAYLEVEHPWRRRGVGAYLLSLQMERAHQAGKKRMALAVSARNTSAQALYRKLGFGPLDDLWSCQLSRLA